MPERDQSENLLRGGQTQPQENDRIERSNLIQETSGSDSQSNGSDNRSDSNGGVRKSNRGFAAMSPERQRAIASEGGRAAHRQGVAHEWSSDEARQAGRKGGQAVSQNREHMSEIGRKGGQRSGNKRSKQQD